MCICTYTCSEIMNLCTYQQTLKGKERQVLTKVYCLCLNDFAGRSACSLPLSVYTFFCVFFDCELPGKGKRWDILPFSLCVAHRWVRRSGQHQSGLEWLGFPCGWHQVAPHWSCLGFKFTLNRLTWFISRLCWTLGPQAPLWSPYRDSSCRPPHCIAVLWLCPS